MFNKDSTRIPLLCPSQNLQLKFSELYITVKHTVFDIAETITVQQN